MERNKNVAVTEHGETEPSRCRRKYVLAAWTSVAIAVVTFALDWLVIANHVGGRGQRPPGMLLFYVVLMVVSGAGILAGVFSFFGIRSWQNASSIIPGALLGICANGFNAVGCLLAYALEGRNLGG